DPSIAARVADSRLVFHPVNVAVARACAAILELVQPGGNPIRQPALKVQRHVGRLEGIEQEPGIDAGRMRYSDHGTSHLRSVIGCEFRMIISDSWQRSKCSSCFQQS